MMNFENIQLPSSLIADLYKQSLVVLDDVQLTPKKTSPQPAVAQPDHKVAETKPAMQPSVAVTPAVAPVPAPPAAESVPAKPVIHYTGQFIKRISVVIKEERSKEIAPNDLEFLKKLMAACKLTIDDLAIINIHSNQPAAQQLWEIMPASAVLMFGVTTSEIGIPFYRPDFQVQHWSDAFFMSAPSLASFQGPDSLELRAMKRELWEGLQKIFLGK